MNISSITASLLVFGMLALLGSYVLIERAFNRVIEGVLNPFGDVLE